MGYRYRIYESLTHLVLLFFCLCFIANVYSIFMLNLLSFFFNEFSSNASLFLFFPFCVRLRLNWNYSRLISIPLIDDFHFIFLSLSPFLRLLIIYTRIYMRCLISLLSFMLPLTFLFLSSSLIIKMII